MNVSEIPQFVTITFDDSVNSHVLHLFRKYVLSVRAKHHCLRVRFTCFVSFDASECDAIQFLLRENLVEIGHHTLDHTLLPSRQDIQGAMDSLVACGVPKSRMGGFRAPFLQYDQSTLDSLYANGVPYDATIIPHDDDTSQFGRENQWPFTLDRGFLDSSVKCGNTGTCAEDKAYPGMWQIPLYSWYYANDTFSNDSMDYSTFDEDVQQNFERRYFGNRAPFGIYVHSYWLEENGRALKKWIQKTMDEYDDVYFVTNMDLLAWMKNPVPKTMYEPPLCNADDYSSNLMPHITTPSAPSVAPYPRPSMIKTYHISPEDSALTEAPSPLRWILSAQLVAVIVLAICAMGRIKRR